MVQDFKHSNLKLLILKGKNQGFLTHREISNFFPDAVRGSMRYESIVHIISEMEITVYEEHLELTNVLAKADISNEDYSVAGSPERTLSSGEVQTSESFKKPDNKPEKSLPVIGCWVRKYDKNSSLGIVQEYSKQHSSKLVKVKWKNESYSWERPENLVSGFDNDWLVEDVPNLNVRQSLGTGYIIAQRRIAGSDQLLIQLNETGECRWLPYENLRRLKDVEMRFLRLETGIETHAKRFQLKLLANALENWNYLTGSLDRLDVDPLPHQIQLVHRVLTSGNHNWIIADDVGLGKTIEMGLILAGLMRKGLARRVLIVCPASLQYQWKDELKFKFDQDFTVLGIDFNSTILDKFNRVIVSIDRAKRSSELRLLVNGDSWDVVVFDEGHKLTRYATGERTQRYVLAENLRHKTDSLFLMSGTPHQGYKDRFIALLQLVRPDLSKQLLMLDEQPEILREIIVRNRKSEVTDSEGNLLFKGLSVNRVPVEPSQVTVEFQKLLHDYLIHGYKAGEAPGKRAIGFVMTIYRKLASSSIAAIERALEKRAKRLKDQETDSFTEDDHAIREMIEEGDNQEELSTQVKQISFKKFFDQEELMIDILLKKAVMVRKADEKLNQFLDQAVMLLTPDRSKLLVFTEFLATQMYLKNEIEAKFRDDCEVLLIHGSMSLDDKLSVVSRFNDVSNRRQFLISTEAGGEGLNLHRSCHIMVNYDLPWNPARLWQRIGRLYRYGQENPVVVINLHAKDSFDNQAIDLMLRRIDEIVTGMATVGSEFNDRLYSEILGDILDRLDLEQMLNSMVSMEIKQSLEEIDAAIERAKEAMKLQEELLSHVTPYDPESLEGIVGFTMEHVETFVRGILPEIGGFIEKETHGGRVLEIRIPEVLRGRFKDFSNRTVVRVTTDRRLGIDLKNVVLLDFENHFFQYLIEKAKSHEFDGLFASICSPDVQNGVLMGAKLRWHNEQGQPHSEEFVTAFCDDNKQVQINPPFIAKCLLSDCENLEPRKIYNSAQRKEILNSLERILADHLREKSNMFKNPDSLVALAIADTTFDCGAQ